MLNVQWSSVSVGKHIPGVQGNSSHRGHRLLQCIPNRVQSRVSQLLVLAMTYFAYLNFTFSSSNATLNFTASEVDVLSLGVSGPSLELAVVVHTASSMLSQEALATILQRATNAIYQATGKIITGITPTPPSASLLPLSTPFPPTQDSGGGILSFLPNALTSLPLPMLIGVIAAGVILLLIIIIFLISTTVIMWGYMMGLWWSHLSSVFPFVSEENAATSPGCKDWISSKWSQLVHPDWTGRLIICLKMPFSYTYIVDIVYYITFVLYAP